MSRCSALERVARSKLNSVPDRKVSAKSELCADIGNLHLERAREFSDDFVKICGGLFSIMCIYCREECLVEH